MGMSLHSCAGGMLTVAWQWARAQPRALCERLCRNCKAPGAASPVRPIRCWRGWSQWASWSVGLRRPAVGMSCTSWPASRNGGVAGAAASRERTMGLPCSSPDPLFDVGLARRGVAGSARFSKEDQRSSSGHQRRRRCTNAGAGRASGARSVVAHRASDAWLRVDTRPARLRSRAPGAPTETATDGHYRLAMRWDVEHADLICASTCRQSDLHPAFTPACPLPSALRLARTALGWRRVAARFCRTSSVRFQAPACWAHRRQP
jgi:hypothetical protein